MKMYGIKNEMKNVVGFVDETKKLNVLVDNEVFNEVFERNIDDLMLEVEMVVENVGDVDKLVEFRKSENKYDVYVNEKKVEFDY